MESSRYQMQVTTVNFEDQGVELTTSYFNSESEHQAFDIKGYLVKTGYQYADSLENHLIVSLKGANIDFSNIHPNTPKASSIEISSSFPGVNKFQVGMIGEDRLKTMDANYLEAAKCGAGKNKCSIYQARAWESNSIYGLGYNLESGLLPDFIDQNYFRPLSSSTNKDEPIYFEPDLNLKNQEKLNINFKINISSTQPKGNYKSIINFIISPPF